MRLPHSWRPFAAWLGIGLLLHLVWETAQLPLYNVWLNPDAGFVTYAVMHCVVGDVLIAGSVYLAAALATRDIAWAVKNPLAGAVVAIPLGVLYTAWSEWHNVYHAGNWQYLPAMPLLFGIGLSPLLQWVCVPLATLLLVRRSRFARGLT